MIEAPRGIVELKNGVCACIFIDFTLFNIYILLFSTILCKIP